MKLKSVMATISIFGLKFSVPVPISRIVFFLVGIAFWAFWGPIIKWALKKFRRGMSNTFILSQAYQGARL